MGHTKKLFKKNIYLLEIIKIQDQLTSLGGERRREGTIKLQQMKNS
jgi:hypothetical protein